MKIEVTKEDIQQGRRCSSFNCPIALAVRRANPDIAFPELNIMVGVKLGWVGTKRFDLPVEASAFIKAFDKGETVVPFTFDVETYDAF